MEFREWFLSNININNASSMEKSRSAIQKQKWVARKQLERTYEIKPNMHALILLDIQSPEIRHMIIEACQTIGVGVILYNFRSGQGAKYIAPSFTGKDFTGFDAVVSDMEWALPIIELLKVGVIPIIPEKSSYGSLFTPFNPIKFQGNAYTYKKVNGYAIFEQIVRFLENKSFPEDHSILIRNVMKTL